MSGSSSNNSSSNADQQSTGRNTGPITAPRNYGPVIVGEYTPPPSSPRTKTHHPTDSATYALPTIAETAEEDTPPTPPTASEALEQTTLREIGGGYLIDTPLAIAHLIPTLLNLPTNPPSLYLDIEGIALGRRGSISIIQLHVLPAGHTYLLDIHVLGALAFTTPSASGTGHTLRTLLEDAAVPKVFFDVRNDSAALHAQFNISLAGVHDVQLMELATRRGGARKYLNSLGTCISKSLSLPPAEQQRCREVKDQGRRLFAPELGGRYEVFNERPLTEVVAAYCAGDVVYLPRLWAFYRARVTLSLIHI